MSRIDPTDGPVGVHYSRDVGSGRRAGRRRRWVRGSLLVVVALLLVYTPFLVWEYSRPQPRPVPGSGAVSTDTAPWVVVLGNPGVHLDAPSHKHCVGTLVSARAVVTAGHCLGGYDPATLTVTAGRDDLRADAGRTVAVAETWVDPRLVHGIGEESFLGGAFGRVTLAPADIGVAILAEPVNGPVLPLADPGSVARGGTPATTFGWRLSPTDEPVLWQAPTTVVDDAECLERAAESVRFVPPRWHGIGYDPSSYLCAGADERAVPLRASDSGSPLVVDGRLAGVAAWLPSAEPTRPIYYTRVAAHHQVLTSLIEQAG